MLSGGADTVRVESGLKRCVWPTWPDLTLSILFLFSLHPDHGLNKPAKHDGLGPKVRCEVILRCGEMINWEKTRCGPGWDGAE